MKVPKFLRTAPAIDESPRRRRRRPRTDARTGGPMSIVPIVDEDETPSWLEPAAPAASPLALDLDAARTRLRREIPPVDDDQ
ncbi:hypothetical protein [Baekduia alba]|uniref:hypothetical protein n=1 Tax=Baekduia alba TaxID=2997333 RepID=UPI0023406C01|nr:hypothetical protein [Baekduia alba]